MLLYFNVTSVASHSCT